MRRRFGARPCNVELSFVLACVGLSLGAARPAQAQDRLREAYASAPLSFEANGGQTDARVKFLARGNGYSVFLTASETVLSFARRDSSSAVVRMTLVGATAPAAISGINPLPGRSHDLRGSDPRRWRTDISTFAKVRYEDVYPGIDVVYHGNQRQLAFDFVVDAKVDPSRIRLRIEGADDIRIDAGGDLVLRVGNHEVRQHKPRIYQGAGRTRREVKGGYELTSGKDVRFAVGAFDQSQPLLIDPVLAYASYLGGSGYELALTSAGIAVDRAGSAYVTGWTTSTDFPTTAGAFQSTFGGGGNDGFVSKFDPTGSMLIYSTYLGGSDYDGANDIAVDESGHAYVTGNTSSPDFPRTPGAYAASCTSCAFVTKLAPSGASLEYSAVLGPPEGATGSAFAIAVDGSGHAYIVGNTGSGLPVTPGAFQPNYGGGELDGYVLKLNSQGSAVVYASFLGGTGSEQLYDIAIDQFGAAYVTGYTYSTDYPTTPGAFQRSCFLDPFFGICFAAFLTKVDPTGSTVTYSTYFGDGFATQSTTVAVDADGHAYIAGNTGATIPTTPGAFQPIRGASTEAFLTKFNVTGSSLVYSTYLGGSAEDGIEGLAVDASGQATVSGWTWSTDFPLANPIQSTLRGREDAFVARFNPSGTALVFSTYLGGSSNDGGGAGGGVALDRHGWIYVVGATSSTDFPVVNGAQQVYGGQPQDFFVAKIAEPWCPPDVTGSLGIFVSPTVPFLIPQFQLQLVLVYNSTANPVEGPLAFVLDGLANGIPLSPSGHPTTCTSAGGATYFLVHPGSDGVLAPGELAGAFVLFLNYPAGPITYVPRVLGGVPTR